MSFFILFTLLMSRYGHCRCVRSAIDETFILERVSDFDCYEDLEAKSTSILLTVFFIYSSYRLPSISETARSYKMVASLVKSMIGLNVLVLLLFLLCPDYY